MSRNYFKGDVLPGHYYVGGNKGVSETFIRLVLWLEEPRGDLRWRDYALHDGKAIGFGRCTSNAFCIWAIREATREEIARCHGDREATGRENARLRTLAQMALTVLSDEELEAELNRRRLMRPQNQKPRRVQ